MRLIDANKEQNRRFHELPEDQRLDFLLNAYSQVFAADEIHRGEFTPMQISQGNLSINIGREERSNLHNAANNLNFLMTRFNMLKNPEYEAHIRELALLRFEYLFLLGKPELTQDPKLVANFFSKRGKPELIRPVLERMGDDATEYEHMAKNIINNPVFEQNVGEDTTTYKFRSRLHTLIEDNDYSKEQAASALMSEGFDLIKCDFNKWYKFENDFDLKIGEKQYKISQKETRWLTNFIVQRSGKATLEEKASQTQKTDDAPLFPVDDDESSQECNCSKEGIENLDQIIKYAISKKGDKTEHWVKELSALTSDHAGIKLNPRNIVEAKMWDHLWGGQFNDLAYQLKGANPEGRTRAGLNYNCWALFHEKHKDTINPILAQDSYAMIIAGDILVGDLQAAIGNLNSAELQRYKTSDKVRAAVNLAWEIMQHPGEDDDSKKYEPPQGYLFHVAKEFQEFLRDTPSAAPYINLINAIPKTKLGKKEEKILQSIESFEDIEQIYVKIGRSNRIRNKFLKIFDETYDGDTEFMSIQSEVRGIVAIMKNPIFRKYVDDETIGSRLYAAVERTLQRKDKYNPEREESGSEKLVLTLYQNSVLRPYLEGRVDVGAMVNGMIDDVVDRKDELLTKPLSLKHQGEISIIAGEAIEAYILADRYRDVVDSEKMQALVAYLLATSSEMTAGSSFGLANFVIDKVGEQADPNYQRPDYFPDEGLEEEEQRIAFLSKVYEREKRLGGLDEEIASIAVTNVIFRGNYVQPGRFYPQIDSMMRFLDSPLAELLPTEGLGHDAIKEYEILRDFLKS